jgi:hypothetical protein
LKESAMNEFADVAAGRFSAWTGLDPTSDPRVLLAPVTAAQAGGRTVRGSSAYDFTQMRRAGSPATVDVWSLPELGLVLIEWPDPADAGLAKELAELGEPELELADQRVAEGGQVRELLYPARGLTLSVVTRPDGQLRAVHVQLYAPATTAYWLTSIGAGPQVHPF